MITINVPGGKAIEADYLLLDYNGTLAVDGSLIDGVREILNELSHDIEIHVITANTFQTADTELSDIKCHTVILKGADQAMQKYNYIAGLNAERAIAVGNGTNDALMLKKAAVGIAVVQQEGVSVEALLNADIVCKDIRDALELVKSPLRMVATLRR
jgi:soluble P-type ATPase